MKIRAKDCKVKLQGDFAKKKVKVGRKVKRANVTEIKVKSKRIIVPLQNQLSIKKAENEKESLHLLLRQLEHYSQPNKISALHEIKEILSDSSAAATSIGLILPGVVELIFDVEKDVRTAVIEVVSFIVSKYEPDSFLSTILVVVTYLCSGLTNIHKGVRKDSLVLLQIFAEKGSHLLMPFLEKLISHVLSLLNESFSSGLGAQSQDAHVALAAQQAQRTQGNVSKEKDAENSKKDKNAAPKVATMFILALKVLKSLLTTAASNNNASRSGTNSSGSDVFGVEMQFDSSSQYNSFLHLRGNKSSICRFLQNAKNKTNSSSAGNSSKDGFSEELAVDICHRLKLIWQGLVLDDSPIALNNIAVLHEVASIVLSIEQSFPQVIARDFHPLISALFAHFPHTCLESTLAQPNSTQERQGNLAVQLLDISLCEVVFAYTSILSDLDLTVTGMDDVLTEGSAYLLESLRRHISGLTSEESKKKMSNDVIMHNNEIVSRIFVSFQMMISSFGSVHILKDLLSLLNKQLFGPVTARGDDSLISFSLTEQSIHCVCDVVNKLFMHLSTADAAETEEQREEIYFLLFESLSTIMSPAVIVKYLAKDAQQLASENASSTASSAAGAAQSSNGSVILKLFTAMLNLARRVPSSSAAGEETVSHFNGSRHKRIEQVITEFTDRFVALFEYTHEKEPFYVYYHSSDAQRYLLLDFYAQAGFDADTLAKVTKSIAKCVSNVAVPAEQQTYFLRILYSKRQEMSVVEYVDTLFAALRINMLSRCASAMTKINQPKHEIAFHSEMVKGALDVSAHWFACTIAEHLRWIASSDHPVKIIAFVLPRLHAYVDSVLVAGTHSYRSSDSADNKWMSQFGWLGCFVASSAVLSIAKYLLVSLDASEALDEPSHAAVNELVALVARVSVAVLLDDGVTASIVHSHKASVSVSVSSYEGELFFPVMALLSLQNVASSTVANQEAVKRLPLLLSEGSASGTFALFTTLFAEVAEWWRTSSNKTTRIKLIKSLKSVLVSRSMNYDTVATVKKQLLSVLRALCDPASKVNKGSKDARSEVEFDDLSEAVRDIIDSI